MVMTIHCPKLEVDARSTVVTKMSAADWLSLAAAPTFVVMALLTGVGGAPDTLCSTASPFAGMVPMYVLMTAFHLRPWLRLISRRRSG
ncbi:hypothetical protein [Bradyrhizobium sp. USDA 10063]